MGDISACTNMACPSRGSCYRYRMVWHEFRQSVCTYTHDDTGQCPKFETVQGRFHVVSVEYADKRAQQGDTVK